MKISKLYIHDFQQFREFELDFTDPRTGMPLENICLIGRNGTGKSTLLNLISYCLIGFPARQAPSVPAAFGIQIEDTKFGSLWLTARAYVGIVRFFETREMEFEKHLRQGSGAVEFAKWDVVRSAAS